ncbi:glutathione S-transferase theta-1-like [Phyllobates terribilis]|uniref:glutathione S-transferase theta-1-like n=1 Tax=Phyllobates terribilis TaxID=111132 RepID=UPI003CCAA4F7
MTYCIFTCVFAGDNLTEEFKKVNPLQKVPVLKDGNFTLVESTAILCYLLQKYNIPDHWYPSDLQKRAHVAEYLVWHHNNTRPYGCRVFWVKCMTPVSMDQEAAPEKMDNVLAEFQDLIEQFEKKFLQERPFVAGDEMSLADLMALVDIMQNFKADDLSHNFVPEIGEKNPDKILSEMVVDALGIDLRHRIVEAQLKSTYGKRGRVQELLGLSILPENLFRAHHIKAKPFPISEYQSLCLPAGTCMENQYYS